MMVLDNVVVKAWLWFMAAAFIIAFVASMPPRRPLASWFGDFVIRWGLAGILVWFVVNGLWAVRELMGMRLILPFSVVEAYFEYATVWGAVFTGLATFIFFGSTLLLNAIFSRPVETLIYYRQVVYAVAATKAAAESLEHKQEVAHAVAVKRRRL
jgi:signal transduction histidine kinase